MKTVPRQDLSWQKQGTCTQTDPELWFPETGGGSGAIDRAKAICRSCPVHEPCHQYALALAPEHGIWAGRSAKELNVERQQTGRDRACDRCGTTYHREHGDQRKFCSDTCRARNRAERQARYERNVRAGRSAGRKQQRAVTDVELPEPDPTAETELEAEAS